MNLPKMIMFDYGHTLLYEKDFDGERGSRALLQYAAKNKNNLSSTELHAFANKIFTQTGDVRSLGYELHNRMFDKFICEYLEIEFSLSPLETETVFWNAAAQGEIMPNTDKMIDYINSVGIRSGVISNISFSGEALAGSINRLLPNNRFEFIIASSEYMFRKPNKMLFELALKKAGLEPEDVWFCGDSAQADIAGAASVGIFPVWYKSELECSYRSKADNETPACEHLRIGDWTELINVLKNCI
jgi:putative hydrolase of the HAD superfamily